jgi:membrane associated rhomboid family serine protease
MYADIFLNVSKPCYYAFWKNFQPKICYRVVHLVVNLLVQLLLGVPLEMVHRWWRVLIVYIAGVVAGSLGTSVTDPYVFLAGASGGVYAILLAHIATIIMVRMFPH